jgi:hypothetical protein
MSSSIPPPSTSNITTLRPFDTSALPAFIEDLDPADLVSDEPSGLWIPEPPTLKDVSRDGGRRT